MDKLIKKRNKTKYGNRENFNVFKSIGNGIKKITKPLASMAKFFELLYKGLIFLKDLVIWLAYFIKWLFTEILNPKYIFEDIFGSLIMMTKLVIYSVLDVIIALIKRLFNFLLEPLSSGIWGWDMPITEENGKCYKINSDNLPFSIIIATVLLPPLGLLMEFGLSFWLNIIICAILTYAYYFPGLIYALILLYQ